MFFCDVESKIFIATTSQQKKPITHKHGIGKIDSLFMNNESCAFYFGLDGKKKTVNTRIYFLKKNALKT